LYALEAMTFLSTSPYAPRTSWGWNARALSRVVAVEPGQEIPLVCDLGTAAGVQSLHVDLA